MESWPSQDDLTARIARTLRVGDQPVAFVVGSGVSLGAVPGTADMINFFRNMVTDDPNDSAEFDALVNDQREWAHKYQTAARFVMDRAGIRYANRAIRLATLSARTPRLNPTFAAKVLQDEEQLEELEHDWRSWALPRGLTYLGRLYASMPTELRGPILTTNFDGLIEVALRGAGLEPVSLALDTDGRLEWSTEPGVVRVIHLHGSWRIGDTMHTLRQLRSGRPQLQDSLRRLLSAHSVVVAGYGGWDDVFTESLLQLVAQGSSRDLDVLWSSYGPEPAMGMLPKSAVGEHLQPYVRVDFNGLMPKVLDRFLMGRVAQQLSGVKRTITPPIGWHFIDDAFKAIESNRTVGPRDAISFFDGRSPQWWDVLGERAPLLSIGASIIRAVNDQGRPSTVLALGPAGEGKSTAMRQVAVHFSNDPDHWRVLWCLPGVKIDVDALVRLPPFTGSYLLVVDDADLHFTVAAGLQEELVAQGRTDFALVLGARDTDWFRASGRTGHTGIAGTAPLAVGGITRDDAVGLINAWSSAGSEGLGRLANVNTHSERVEALMSAAASNAEGETALLGALLAVRYGNELRQHVRSLMSRTARVELPSSKRLVEAYLAICLSAEFNLPPLTLDILASYCEMSVSEVDVLVVARLGREAAVELHGDLIRARHPHVARAAFSLAAEYEVDTKHLLGAVVASAVARLNGRSVTSPADVDWSYCGQAIADKGHALVAARVAAEKKPAQMRLLVNYAHVLRLHEEFDEAARVAEATWRTRGTLADANFTSRRFLLEWARVCGLSGRWGDSAALVSIALIDHPDMRPVEPKEACRALSGLALSLNHLSESQTESGKGFKAAARFAAEAGLLLDPDSETLLQLQRTRRQLGDGQVPSDFASFAKTVAAVVRMSREAPVTQWKRAALPMSQLKAIL